MAPKNWLCASFRISDCDGCQSKKITKTAAYRSEYLKYLMYIYEGYLHQIGIMLNESKTHGAPQRGNFTPVLPMHRFPVPNPTR